MFKKLKTAMFANDVDQKMVSENIQRSQSYVTSRMSGKAPFTIDDIYSICDLLEIPYNEIADYFPKNGKELKKV